MNDSILPVHLTEDEEVSIYPGFWKRLAACLVDSALLGLVSVPFICLMHVGKPLLYAAWSLSVPAALMLHVYCVARWGGSPGKLLLNMRIVRMNGRPAGVKEAALRYAVDCALVLVNLAINCFLLSAISGGEYSLMNGFTLGRKLVEQAPAYGLFAAGLRVWAWANLIAFFCNRRHRVLVDYIAGTVVVDNRYRGEIAAYVEEQDALWSTGEQEPS